MIRSIVIEDEWYNLEEVSRFVNNTGFIVVEKKYQNPLIALEEVLDVCPQVAFIDIEMPEMDGITLAEKLLEKNSQIVIVFITAFNQYAVQAFDLNALDYIMKPINAERFKKMAEKIKNEINSKRTLKANILKINCSDRLEVTIDKKEVRWQRAKAEELFAYLLMNNGRFVHKEIIIENLWHGYQLSKALTILQTSICKIRNVLSEVKREDVTIDYSGGKYCLTINNSQCNYIEFQEALDGYKAKDKDTYYKVEKACKLFGNGFLVKEDYIWIIGKNEELSNRLVAILKEIILAYSEQHNYIELVRFLKLLAILRPYEEEVNYKLLMTLEKLGNHEEALSHYKWLEKTLLEQYDTIPSNRIRMFCQNPVRIL